MNSNDFDNLNFKDVVELCDDVMKKIHSGNLLDKESYIKLYNEYSNLVYENFGYKIAEEKLVGHNVENPAYISKIKDFYIEKLLPYEKYINLLNINADDLDKVIDNFNKYIDLYVDIEKSNIEIDEDRCFNILFRLMLNEIVVFKTSKILDSFNDIEVLKSVEILKSKINKNSKLYQKLSSDVVRRIELKNILFEYTYGSKEFSSENKYSENTKNAYIDRLNDLKKERTSILNKLTIDHELEDLKKLEEINNQIDELKTLKKEEKDKLKNRLFKKIMFNSGSRLHFDFDESKWDSNHLYDAGGVAIHTAIIIAVYATFMPFIRKDTSKVEVTSTNLKNNKEYSEIYDAEEYNIGLEFDIQDDEQYQIIKYYSPWEYNGTDYQREVINYSINSELDLNNLENYLNQDPIKKEVEHCTSLNSENLYTEGYFEISNLRYFNTKEIYANEFVILFAILDIIFRFSDFLCSGDLSFTLPITCGLIPLITCVKIKIDNGEEISKEEIDEIINKIKETTNQIKLKRNELENIKNKEQLNKEEMQKLNKRLSTIDANINCMEILLKGIENPNLIHISDSNKNVTLNQNNKEEGTTLAM